MLPLILLVDLVGLLLGAAVVFRGRAPVRVGAEILRFLGFAFAYGVAAALLTGAANGSPFAVLRITCHVLFCVLAPLLLLRGLWLLLPRHGGTLRALGLVLALSGVLAEGVYLYARRVEPFRLQVRRHVVESPALRGLERPLKIVVLADLQTDRVGEYEAEVFRRLDAERADLVLLPGDFLQLSVKDPRHAAEQQKLVELFTGLTHDPELGIWAVDGDADVAWRSLRGSQVGIVNDRTVLLSGEPPIQLIGLGLGGSRAPLSGPVRAALARYPGYSIVMGHAPEFMQAAIDGGLRPDCLMVAGHTHGGQVVVPGFGPPITLSGVARKFAAGGLFRLGPCALCISRGVGMERGYAPRIRLFCPPELVVVELRGPREPG